MTAVRRRPHRTHILDGWVDGWKKGGREDRLDNTMAAASNLRRKGRKMTSPSCRQRHHPYPEETTGRNGFEVTTSRLFVRPFPRSLRIQSGSNLSDQRETRSSCLKCSSRSPSVAVAVAPSLRADLAARPAIHPAVQEGREERGREIGRGTFFKTNH